MPTITRIQQQKDANRANIYLDGKFAFGITLEVLLKYHLDLNKEISEETIVVLKSEDAEEKIYARAVTFSMLRPRSEKEIRDWFKRKKVPEEVVEVVFNRLKNLNLVDDVNFAKWWIEQRQTFRPKSKRFIQFELRKKGINNEIITELLAEWGSENEESIALSVATKRMKRLTHLPVDEQRKKLTQFLAGRGFSWPETKKVIDQIVEK